jgi:hypothetical protein
MIAASALLPVDHKLAAVTIGRCCIGCYSTGMNTLSPMPSPLYWQFRRSAQYTLGKVT